MTEPASCSECRPPEPRFELRDLPRTWRTLDAHPRLEPAPWLDPGRSGPLRFCEACGAFWYLVFDPREGAFSGAERLGTDVAPLLQDGVPPERIRPFLTRASLADLASGWIQHAGYDPEAMLRLIVSALASRDLDAGEVLRLLRHLVLVLTGPNPRLRERVAAIREGGAPFALPDASPLLRAWDKRRLFGQRSPAEADALKEAIEERLRAFAYFAFHPTGDWITVAPEVRAELVRRYGEGQPMSPPSSRPATPPPRPAAPPPGPAAPQPRPTPPPAPPPAAPAAPAALPSAAVPVAPARLPSPATPATPAAPLLPRAPGRGADLPKPPLRLPSPRPVPPPAATKWRAPILAGSGALIVLIGGRLCGAYVVWSASWIEGGFAGILLGAALWAVFRVARCASVRAGVVTGVLVSLGVILHAHAVYFWTERDRTHARALAEQRAGGPPARATPSESYGAFLETSLGGRGPILFVDHLRWNAQRGSVNAETAGYRGPWRNVERVGGWMWLGWGLQLLWLTAFALVGVGVAILDLEGQATGASRPA